MEHPRGVQFKFFCRQGEEYCLASGEFLRVTMLAEAAECLVKAAECFSKDRSWTRAAKALENACDIRIKLGPPEKTTAVAVARQAAMVYVKANQTDAAAEVLEKAANALFDDEKDESVKLFNEAISLVEVEQRPTLAAILSVRLMNLLLARRETRLEGLRAGMRAVHLYQVAENHGKVGQCLIIVILLSHIHI